MGIVESASVGVPGKALIRDATRRLRLVVHAVGWLAGWLHFMVLHSRCVEAGNRRFPRRLINVLLR